MRLPFPTAAISAALAGATIRTQQPVSGGDIGEAYRLELADGRHVFAKLYTDARGAARAVAEARGLALLSRVVATPPVLASGAYETDRGFILLEWLPGEAPADGFFEHLGERLAALHRCTQDRFGLDHANFIGRLAQVNPPCDDWPAFYVSARLEPQLRQACDAGRLTSRDRRAAAAVFAAVATYPLEPPALLHGDLWSGNYLCGPRQTPYFIDPAVYYGHREMDLALMQLFGGFPAPCFAAYAAAYPLAPGWRDRLPLGQLYYLLVHLNLFGGNYVSGVRDILHRY